MYVCLCFDSDKGCLLIGSGGECDKRGYFAQPTFDAWKAEKIASREWDGILKSWEGYDSTQGKVAADKIAAEGLALPTL